MFKVTMSGKNGKLVRTLNLPQTGPLPAHEISLPYEFKIDLADLDAKSPIAADILKRFPKVLANDLNNTRARHDAPCIKIWTDTAALISKGKASQADMEKAAAKAEKDITALFNDYYRNHAQRYVDGNMKSLATDSAKKTKEQVKVPAVKLSDNSLKENRVGVLSAALGAITASFAGGPLGWLLGALAGVGALTKGYKNAWELSKKQSANAQDNLNRINDGLDSALATLQGLKPSLDSLTRAQDEMQAAMIKAKNELNTMEKDLGALEARAKTEKAVREGQYIKKMREDTQVQADKIDKLRSALANQTTLAKSVRDATAAVEAATKNVTAQRGRWDKIMVAYLKVSKDGDTFISTVIKGLSQLK